MRKICIITGATDGIGKQTALELAYRGFSLGLVSRNKHKGDSIVTELISKTGNDSIRFHQADLSIMSSIKKLADEIQNSYETIDVLINNAGAYFCKFEITDEGFESTYALNHLAYFNLTKYLLDLVKEGCSGRVVNIASSAHRNIKLDFNDIQGIKNYNGWPAYGRSKLMNIMFTYECHKRFYQTGITFNCLHPGFVNSNFGNNNSGFSKGFLQLAKSAFAINVGAGANCDTRLRLK